MPGTNDPGASRPLRIERIPHGFSFGVAEVTCLTELPRGVAVVRVKTPKATLDIRVTKTGRVRVFQGPFEVMGIR